MLWKRHHFLAIIIWFLFEPGLNLVGLSYHALVDAAVAFYDIHAGRQCVDAGKVSGKFNPQSAEGIDLHRLAAVVIVDALHAGREMPDG